MQTYGKVDTMDHMMKNTRMFYRSWKYWHAAMLHAKRMAIVIAYDIYRECTEGNLNQQWKMTKVASFFTFRDKLAEQMLNYSPKHRRYPGDNAMRTSTQQNQKKRGASSSDSSYSPVARGRPPAGVTPEDILDATTKPWNPDGGRYPRLCGDLDMLIKHAKTFATGKRHSKVCVWCGAPSYAYCGACGVALCHQFSKRGKPGDEAKHCFMYWHNTNHFGLAKSETLDYQPNKRKSDWKEPSTVVEKRQKDHIHRMLSRGSISGASSASGSNNKSV